MNHLIKNNAILNIFVLSIVSKLFGALNKIIK